MATKREVPDAITTSRGVIYEFPAGPYIQIEGEPYPFLLERVDERGVFLSECRPYFVTQAGYLKSESPKLRVLRKPKQIEEARWLLFRGVTRGIQYSEVFYDANRS